MSRFPLSRLTLFLTLPVLLLLIMLSAAAGPPQATAQGSQLPPINLKSRTAQPSPGIDPATAGALLGAEAAARGKASSYHAIVQLDHIPSNTDKAALAAKGIHLQNYLPRQAWVARIDARADKANALVGKDGVAWIGALLPSDKLAPGLAADLASYRLDTLGFAGGAAHDPLAALVFCQPPGVDLSVIDGRVRVRDGRLLGVDLPPLIARHNAIARALARGERP